MESQSLSVPELCLYTFTNRKCGASAIFPHKGRQIIRERTQSSNARVLGQQRPKTHVQIQKMKLVPSTNDQSKRFQSTRQYVSRVKTSGYTLTRSASAVEMKINMDKFFEPAKMMEAFKPSDGRKDKTKLGGQSYADMIHRITKESIEAEERLQREIVNLSVQLKNQESQYKEQIQQYEKERKDMKIRMERQYSSEQKYLTALHEQQMQLLSAKWQQDLSFQKREFAAEKALYEKEIEEHKKLVKETKKEMRQETKLRLMELETEMKESHTEEIKKVKQQMNKDMETAVLEGKQEVTEQYEQEMSQMIKSYKAQIERMIDKANSADDLANKLAAAETSLKQCTDTVKYLSEQLEVLKEEKQTSEIQLLKKSEELKDLKENFSEKVKEVEEHFMSRLDNLRLENSQLRGRIIQLSEESVSYHAKINEINIKGQLSARLRLRTALKMRQAPGKQTPATDLTKRRKTRCNSVPNTQKEVEMIKAKVEEYKIGELVNRPYTTSYIIKKIN